MPFGVEVNGECNSWLTCRCSRRAARAPHVIGKSGGRRSRLSGSTLGRHGKGAVMRTLWKPAVLLTLLTTAGVSSVLVAQTAADPERNREVVRRHLELMNL